MGDHNPIIISYRLIYNNNLNPIIKKRHKKRKNYWNNVHMLEEYSERSETELNKLRDLKNDIIIEKIDVKSILNTGIRIKTFGTKSSKCSSK